MILCRQIYFFIILKELLKEYRMCLWISFPLFIKKPGKEEEIATCNSCGSSIRRGETVFLKDGEKYCEDCAENLYIY